MHKIMGVALHVHKGTSQTYIRPILEYAAVIWSPYTQTYIQQVEMIQRKAARFIFSNYSRFASVTTMLNKLNWQSLEKRRNDLTLAMFHKIINHQVDIHCNHILQITPNHTRSSSKKFLHLPSRIDSYLHSFFPRAIRLWNHLPDYVVETDNFDSYF